MALSEDELHTLRIECYLDSTLFARTFVPHWFPTPMSWAHRGLLALLTRRADFLLNFGREVWPTSEWEWTPEQLDKILRFFTYKDDFDSTTEEPKPYFTLDGDSIHLRASQKTSAMMPRGVGKTTIVNLSNLIGAVYKDYRFLLYTSETATHAEEQLGNIKRELESNEKIEAVFGTLRPERTAGRQWNQDFIETTHGVMVAAIGRGGQVRGKNVNATRPDRIVVDDLEDDESVSTDEQLRKAKTWVRKALLPALPQMGKTGEAIFIGTLLHPEAVLMSLTKDPEFVSVVFGAMDPDYYADGSGDSIAPFYISKEAYEAKRLSFARDGMLMEFEMEYGSRIFHDEDSRKFDVSKIRFQVMKREEFLGVAEVLDPAISDDRRADFAAIGVAGITERGQIHVLDMWEKKGAHPRELIDKYFDLHFEWNPTHHGIEAIAYQAALVHLVQEEMFRRAKTFGVKAYFEIIKETKQLHGIPKKKTLRVEGMLAPRYKAGYITHQRHFGQLEIQLRDWPLGKKDCPDVLAMCVALLDPYAATALGENEDPDDDTPLFYKDDYEPLDIALGDWRGCP